MSLPQLLKLMYPFQTAFEKHKNFYSCTMFSNASPQDHFWGDSEDSDLELPQTHGKV